MISNTILSDALDSPLCRALVSIVDPSLPPVIPAAIPGRTPLIERLCYHLTETNRKDAEVKNAPLIP